VLPPGLGKAAARVYIEEQSGKQFDPQVVCAFVVPLDELADPSLLVERRTVDGPAVSLLLDKEGCHLAADQLVPSVRI
jgi:HD-GYP domain-containing protein (c-di-GMP phosphodiesterase class II)